MENSIKGMTTCKVCGRDFPLIAEEHYISKEAGKEGIAAVVGGLAPILWDSFDCPHCGCQNRLHMRYRLTDNLGREFPLDCGENEEEEDDESCWLNRGKQG